MQTRFWKNQLFITTVSTWLQSAEQGVEHLEASDTEHQFQDATYLCSANWTTVQETGFYHPSNWKLPMCDESLSLILSRPNKVLHELHVCWSYLMLLNRTVYSLTWEMHFAGCELHIQTLMFPIILTLKQYVNTKTIWGSEVRNISCHDDYYQPLVTYMASIPAHSWSFFKEAGFFRNDHFTPGLQSVFYADCSNHWTRLISRITNAKVWVICWSQETRSVFFFAAAKCQELSTV